jgi:hypothetical protein
VAIRSYKDLVDAEENGQTFIGGFRKVVTAQTGQNAWFDITLSPGNPLPFYYASTPLFGQPLSQSVNGGFPHNQPVASLGYKTYLKTFTISPVSAAAFVGGPMILMDYLFYYPFIDTGNTDEQFVGQSEGLPRYTDGKGVSVMAVQMAGMLGTGNPTFRFTYINQDGILKTSPTQTCGSASIVGELATGNNSAVSTPSNYPFLPLAIGDTGIQSIVSVTFDQPDIGLLAFVLVKPLEHIALREAAVTAERTPVTEFFDLPVIEDDAFLSILFNSGNQAASQAGFIGTIQTVWG